MMKDRYRVLIISCWSLLGVCFLIKLLGGNWFELSTENTKLIQLCSWIDSNISKYFIMGIFYCVSMYLVYLSICKKKIKDCLYICTIFALIFITKIFYPIVATVLEPMVLIVLPLVKRVSWKRVLLGNVLMMVFQLVSLFIRNLGMYLPADTPTLISLLLQIDYYIMLVLYYLYSNYRKERE